MLISANISLKQRRMRLERNAIETPMRQLLKYLQNKKRYGKKNENMKGLCKFLVTDDEKVHYPDEIKLKLSQIHTWREDTDDKYKNNV